MNTRREPLLIGDPNQQGAERVALLRGKRGANGIVVLARDLADRFEHLGAFAGEMQRVNAPILRRVAPLDQAARFELVDERHETTRRDSEDRAQPLLARASARLNDAE